MEKEEKKDQSVREYRSFLRDDGDMNRAITGAYWMRWGWELGGWIGGSDGPLSLSPSPSLFHVPFATCQFQSPFFTRSSSLPLFAYALCPRFFSRCGHV